MARYLLLLAFVIGIGFSTAAEEKKEEAKKIVLDKDVSWKRLEFAIEDSVVDDKMIMLFISKSWCKPCHKLAEDFLDNKEFKELSKEFHMAAFTDDDAPLDSKYDLDGKYAPKIIFQDSKGNVLSGVTNGGSKTRYFYKKADKVVESMKKALLKTSLDQGFGKEYDWKSYEDGLEACRRSGKPMLLIIHQDWCGSCQRLKPKIAASDDLIKMGKNFVMVNTEEEHVVKRKEFDIDGEYYPKIVFLDNNGEVLKEHWNHGTEHKHVKYYYGEPDELIKSMQKVLDYMSTAKPTLDRGMGKHIDWKTYEEGLAIAKQEKKPVIVLIHKSYCGACKALKPKIKDSKEIAELSKQFVMINCLDDEEPSDSQFDIDGAYIPRMFFLDSNGIVEPSIKNELEDFKKVQYAYGDAEQIAINMKKALEMNLGTRQKQEELGLGHQINWFNLENGLAEAQRKSHRRAMIIFHNSWCSFSKAFAKMVRESDDIKKLNHDFVMISAQDEPASSDEKYDIDGQYTPRVFFADNKGNIKPEINNTETEYPLTKFYYKNSEELIKAMQIAKETINVSLARGFSDYIDWQTLPKAKELAKEQNKPVMVIIHRTWCSACKALKPKFAENYDIYELSKNFIMVNVEDDEEPEDTQFIVDGGYYPRMFFLNPNGDVVKEIHNENPSFLKYKFSFNDVDSIVLAMRNAIKLFTEQGTIPVYAAHATAGDPIHWVQYKHALKLAKESKKPIFLLIHRTSCPACKAVHRMLIRDEKFMDKIQDFVMVEIEDDVQTEVADKFDIDGTYVPRIYFVDYEGEIMKKIWNIGTQYQENKFYYYETASVIRAMDKALNRIKQMSTKKQEKQPEDEKKDSTKQKSKDEL
eukprot:Seg2052.5 transcript_id=Seg2052.5/GoldUCD/mRNA.D3Y31 product="Thioredoxin domain-containing protein 12" protein_id=Seg2052.5/GoldUCD/D3Y31